MGVPGLISGILFSLSTICFVFAVSLTTAANTLVIMAATPLFAALFTRVFLREMIPARTWIAVTVGFSGLGILFWGSIGGGKVTGDILALMCACIMAANFVLIRRFHQIDMVPGVAISGFLTALSVLPMCDGLMLQSGDVLYLVLMGTIVLPVPLAVMTIVPKLIPAAEVSLILLLETFLGPLWVWMGIGQVPSFRTVIGGVVLIVTIMVHSLVGLRGVRNGEGAEPVTS
jgi:drug/metabolite transporter (DMT)-like permease